MNKPYVVKYDKKWPITFQQTRSLMMSTIGDDLSLYHIGSTAIPQMSAKPCIDMLGVIKGHAVSGRIIPLLQAMGYEYRGEYGIIGRYYFVKLLPVKYHLHIFVEGATEIKKHLFFVQIMLERPNLVKRFSDIKEQLHQCFLDDKSSYQQKKAFFYDELFDEI